MMILEAESRPLLASRVRSHGRPSLRLVESNNFEYRYEGPSAELLQGVLPRLRGEETIADLARDACVTVRDLVAVLSPLNTDENLIIDLERPSRTSSGGEFVAALKEECRFWADEIYSQPFWAKVQSGEASTAVVLGWGIEFYHFVDSVNEYMAAGVANCREDAQIREVLVKHYVEESGHGEIFLKGLERCGIDPPSIRMAPPLPSTRALINYLYEVALGDCCAYAGLFAVMQSSGDRTSKTAIDSFYDPLCRMYPSATGMFQAFKEHALIDVQLDHHKTTLEEIAELAPERILRSAPSTLGAARSLVEHFILFFEGIDDYYSRSRAPLPRRKLGMTSVM